MSEIKKSINKAYLIGCGTGDVELLTIKAYRLIQSMDVVLVDKLLGDEILDIIPTNINIIDVGKQKNKISYSQDRINELLEKYLSQGLKVARLKTGDPFIFGRGGEEGLFLLSKGYDFEVIPGISSCVTAPLSAGIPITHRDVSSGFSVVSPHLKDKKSDYSFLKLLSIPKHTTIVLMGLSKVKEIKKYASYEGVQNDLPVAIISKATQKEQSHFITTINELDNIPKHITSPAVIVFGEVVKYANFFPKYIHSIEKVKEYIA